MKRAIEEASRFRGATSPNPPVGAVALSAKGEILSVQAHEKAGTLHAEAKVIEDCRARGILDEVDTLVVTLEPCNHTGRTPPCSEAILKAGIKKVVYGVRDPNPRVQGSGAEFLAANGVEVQQIPELKSSCDELIEPFKHWISTGLPWVTVKMAINSSGTMIPPEGVKTFTSQESLKLAHELRRRADAILTGSGTILADTPEFTVRIVADHADAIRKKRWLMVLDRRGRTPRAWIEGREKAGFRVQLGTELVPALQFLGREGCLEVLVEAGPTLAQAILTSGLWNELIVIRTKDSGPDQVEKRKNVHWNHPDSRSNLAN